MCFDTENSKILREELEIQVNLILQEYVQHLG